MTDFTIKRLDEIEGRAGGRFKLVRDALGIESFGIQVIEFPPNADRYPNHNHVADGQEEVYFALSGSGEIEIDGERIPLDQETFVRVGPEPMRKITAGPDGLRLLALGGVPGKAYEPSEMSKPPAPKPGV